MVIIKLQNLIESKGWTQSRLSDETNIRRATISYMCSNTSTLLRVESLNKICRVLNCKIEENDETRLSPADREHINFEAALIDKMIEAREERGMSQRELAEISGVKQPAIARMETLKATPQIDTLFKVLYPLGYTMEIVPLDNRKTGVN